MPDLVSISEFARRKGVTHVTVLNALKTGRIEVTMVGPTKFIDAETQLDAWDDNASQSHKRWSLDAVDAEPGKKSEKNEKVAATYAESRAVRENYNARMAKAEYEEKIGKLIDANKVKADAFEIGRVVRDNILNISAKVAPELAAETNPYKVEEILDGHLRKALETLATS